MASNKSLKPYLNKILKILKQVSEPKEQFYHENQIAASEFEVKVANVGKLNFPLTDEVIQSLKSISSEAKFGLRDQTLLDKNVRDTCEIKPDKFEVKFNPEYFENLLSEISHGLGLVDVKLEAHLYNLLIYGPGQFFKMHQDTEKLEGMIGTLIVLLPSPHIGGDLIIQHLNHSYTFKSENLKSTTIKYVAFYCDCNHEVTKVTEGYRVALVYNLVLSSKQAVNIIGVNLEKLKLVVKKYFSLVYKSDEFCSTEENYFYRSVHNDGVPKLAYYLDYEYTEWGLKWHSLKGNDQRNATALHNIALELNLIPHLALVKVKQTVEAEYYESDSSNSERILEHEAIFEFWIDRFDKRVPFEPFEISRKFICMTKKNEEYEPHDESTEYTGNEGTHESCWYRRAAVVLWEKSLDLLMSFTYDYDNAFRNFLCLMDLPEKEEEVLEIIETVGGNLYRITSDQKKDFKQFVAFALNIDHDDIAFKLLSPFNLTLLESDIAEELAKLQDKYGIAFITKLLPQWQKRMQWQNLSNILVIVNQLFVHCIDTTFIQTLLEQDSVKHDYRNLAASDQKKDFKQFVEFALRVDHYDIAFKLLSHFHLEILESDIAEELAKLQDKYGIAFITKLLPQWKRSHVLSNILLIVNQLFVHGIDVTFIHKLLEQECDEIVKQDYRNSSNYYYTQFPTINIAKHLDNVKQILQANSRLLDETIHSSLYKHIISKPDLYPLMDLLNMLFSMTEGETFLSYKPLQEYLITKINEMLATYGGSGSKSNWSILKELPCSCEHCVQIKHFLHSKTETKKVISVALKFRNHILRKFETKKLPVDVYVDKKKSPHRLVIEKQQTVFTDSGKKFDELNYFLCKINKL